MCQLNSGSSRAFWVGRWEELDGFGQDCGLADLGRGSRAGMQPLSCTQGLKVPDLSHEGCLDLRLWNRGHRFEEPIREAPVASQAGLDTPRPAGLPVSTQLRIAPSVC